MQVALQVAKRMRNEEFRKLETNRKISAMGSQVDPSVYYSFQK